MEMWVFLSLMFSCGLCLQCLDDSGNPVDWFYVYKSALISSSKDWKFRHGLAQFYMDVHSPQWSVSDKAINETDHAIYNTMIQIYNKGKNDQLFLMYNDEGPVSFASNGGGHTKGEDVASTNQLRRGHTKGVVAFDRTSGFWMVHSVPKYPPRVSDNYAYPYSADDFGQTFLCISMAYKQLGTVATQLLFNEPHIFDFFTPESFVDDFPVIHDLTRGKAPPGPPWYSVASLMSINGQKFLSFAKSKGFNADLYDALVAPTLKQDLLVETWLRGTGTELDSNCSATYKVMKVTDINLIDVVDFSETKDHAKWAVSISGSRQSLKFEREQPLQHFASGEEWACVGDINRMESQFHRGGGTVCQQNTAVWSSFRNSVAEYEDCHLYI